MTAGSIPAPMVIPMRVPQAGKSKTIIDTNTKIALTCNDAKVIIYYTINGTKPEPFQPRTTPGFCTIRYRNPIKLPSGKVTLKALAIAKDGVRESNVVSKTFDVEYVSTEEETELEEDNSLAFQDEIAEEKVKLQMKRSAKNLQLSAKSAWKEVPSQKNVSQLMTNLSLDDGRKPQTSVRFLDERLRRKENSTSKPLLSTKCQLLETIADQLSASEWKGIPEPRKPPENSTQSLRLQRQTDFLKCVYCFADRPADPCAKFCNVCGKPVPPLPQNRLPPPEPGQMGLCLYCNSLVPLNTDSCVVCEGPIPMQNQPQASIKLSDRLVCFVCGTANPSNLFTCVLCDSKLSKETHLQKFPAKEEFLFSAPGTNNNAKFLKCSKCLRINNIDARFCDWCGSQPNQSSCIQCSNCRANNHVMSTYCGGCGMVITPPYRNTNPNASAAFGTSGDNQWLPMSRNHNPMSRLMNSVATQTVGLFYPSQREIRKKEEEESEKAAFEKQMRDRQPLLTAISPGRGYWRKQIEHICQHLKVHAQNCADFRALIAEPKMGKLVSGTLHEDAYELSLTLNFALWDPPPSMANGNVTVTPAREDYMSPYPDGNILESFRSESSQVSETTEDSATEKVMKTKKIRKMKLTKKTSENRLAPIDRKLLKEVGAKGGGEVSQVQQLIDEGADPNCTNKDGVPVLCVAVKNKHKDCIPVIVQAGAVINQKGPPSCHGNTALHQAVNLGPEGVDILEVLLRCGADMKKKNDRGETAYDLAIKSGYEVLSRRLVASLGQSQLEKLLRGKQTPLE